MLEPLYGLEGGHIGSLTWPYRWAFLSPHTVYCTMPIGVFLVIFLMMNISAVVDCCNSVVRKLITFSTKGDERLCFLGISV